MMWNDNRNKILKFFLIKPTYGFSLRELERLSGLGLPSVKKYVLEFVKQSLVVAKRIKRFNLYVANREDKKFKRIKIFYNIRKMYESGLVDFINRKLSYPTIVLFGSLAKGDDVESSDIDLFIESQEKNIDLSKFEKKLGRRIQVFIHKSIRGVRNKYLMNNIVNGIVLEGFLEVFN